MLFTFSGCADCSLKKQWPYIKHPQIPFAPPTYFGLERIVMIGEGPGEHEDAEGIPFVGTTGQYLRKSIPQTWRERIYVGNMIRCLSKDNEAPRPQDILCCSTYLQRDLAIIKPNAIFAIGSVALNYFWDGMGITIGRGVPFPTKLNDGSWVWVFSTFHPSYVQRGGNKEGTNIIEPVFLGDIKYFFDNMQRWLTPPNPPPIPSKTEIYYPRTYDEIVNLFNKLKEPFGYDIETFMLKPYQRDAKILTAAFSDGTTHFAFPVSYQGIITDDGYRALNYCMSQNKRWVGHNSAFELTWMWYHFPNCSLLCPYEDSMAIGRVKYNRSPKASFLDLGNQTKIAIGTDIKTITNVDAAHLERYSLEQTLYYNALDAWGSWAIYTIAEMDSRERTVYDRLIAGARSTVTMELLGLPVDLKASSEQKKALTEKKSGINEKAQNLPEVIKYKQEKRTGFSITSNYDVGEVLSNYCGLKLPKTPSGQYSTSADNLQEYLDKHPLVNLRLDNQEIAKLLGTYVEPILNGKQLATDGWLHPSYTTMLTATLRLSANDPSIQNFPKRRHREVRRQVIPPPGFKLVACDYGQLEARGIAMASGDRGLIESFIRKEDIHTRWLNRLLNLYPPYLDKLARGTGQSEAKEIRKYARDIIKTDFVFASLYGSRAASVSARTQIPLRICEEALEEFWGNYPGVKRWIDNQFIFYKEHGYVEMLTGIRRNEVLPGMEPINNPIQGMGAHIVLEAQIALWNLAVETNDFNLIPRIQIHDDIVWFLPDNEEDLYKYISIIGAEMTKPRFSFSICPLMVEIKVCDNWADGEEVAKIVGDYIRN